jgi:FAD/FMN-containing dehydrogenase
MFIVLLSLFLSVADVINVTTKSLTKPAVRDFSRVSQIPVEKIFVPHTLNEMETIVKNSKKPIAIAGGKFSQGGQAAYRNGIVIDMKNLNHILNFDPVNKEITVQAGITWARIQQFCDKHNLSVKVMQSYNDFSVGGSLGVNVHGRDIHYGPIIQTVKSFIIMLADGSLLKASRTENSDLFYGAIGGYGLLGIIVQATLSLTDNEPLERCVYQMPVDFYAEHFNDTVLQDSKTELHNANVYPPQFNSALSIIWRTSDKPLTVVDRLQHKKKIYPKEMFEEQLLRRFALAKKVRPFFEFQRMCAIDVVMRNYEMSTPVKILQPLFRFPTTTILQEYFVPCAHLNEFINQLRTIVKTYGVNLVNISIRYVPADTESLLSYAPVDSFSLVLYINIGNTRIGKKKAERWTRTLIDAALCEQGSFYLPYQPFATYEQMMAAYPKFNDLLRLKAQYDPHTRFRNMLYAIYVEKQPREYDN